MKITNLITILPWHHSRRWSTRALTKVDRIIIHQELGEASVGAVNRFHIQPNYISSRGCPHFCYHYGIEKTGEIVQANDLRNITWHTKGQNERGIGIMVVGNFRGPGHEEGEEGPGEKQMKSLQELCEYLVMAFEFSKEDIYGHYHFGKAACPGSVIQSWIEERREK